MQALGRRVVVLEARARVGGRLCNTLIGGQANELGGAWVAPYHKRVHALAAEIGIALFPSHRAGRHVYVDRGGVARTYDADAGESLPLAPETSAALDAALDALQAIAGEIDASAPWLHPRAAELDAMPFSVWLDRALGTDAVAKDVLRALVCDCFMTKEASAFSVLSVIGTVVAGAGGVQQLFNTAQCLHSRVVGGSQALADGLVARLAPSTVLLNVAVRHVRWSPDACAVEVHAGTAGARCIRIRARHAIIATPPNIAATLEYAPPLPQWRVDVHAGCPQGSVIKVLVEYATPFWRDAGLAGEGFAPHALVKEVYDNSPPSGVPGVLCVFLTGPVADAARATDAAARRALVLNGVATFFGARARTEAVSVHECDWSGEEFTRGGYCGTFAVGALTRCGRDRMRPVGPLHFCCTELASEGHMHMEGALRSGAAAAADVHTRLKLGAHGASKL